MLHGLRQIAREGLIQPLIGPLPELSFILDEKKIKAAFCLHKKPCRKDTRYYYYSSKFALEEQAQAQPLQERSQQYGPRDSNISKKNPRSPQINFAARLHPRLGKDKGKTRK